MVDLANRYLIGEGNCNGRWHRPQAAARRAACGCTTMILETLDGLIRAGIDALQTTCGLTVRQAHVSLVGNGSLTFPALGELRIRNGTLQTVHLGCDTVLVGQLPERISGQERSLRPRGPGRARAGQPARGHGRDDGRVGAVGQPGRGAGRRCTPGASARSASAWRRTPVACSCWPRCRRSWSWSRRATRDVVAGPDREVPAGRDRCSARTCRRAWRSTTSSC